MREVDPMRVMNLAQPLPGLRLEMASSLGAELLMSMLAVSDVTEDIEEAADYDLGVERLRRIREQIDPRLLQERELLTAGCGKVAGNLLGLVYTSPEPRDVPSLLTHIEATDPREVLLHLIAFYMKAHRGPTPEDVIVAAADGDPAAVRRYLTDYETTHRGRWEKLIPSKPLELGKDEVKGRLLRFVRRWHQEVWPLFDDNIAGVLATDLKAKQVMARENMPERTIELATNGIQHVPEATIGRVMLFPTYVLRPWVLISEYQDVKVYCYPVSDDSIDVDESLPPPQLVKLYKALGDSNRLRLLKRLSNGAMTLKEATEILGSAKSTAYHHLAILRQAGLVWVREDEDRTYTLRDDLIPVADELLQGYLRIRPKTVVTGRRARVVGAAARGPV
ncbi:MAG: ArsR/SmtB family transcription factor [Actinomycetota bacterium]